AGLGRLLGLLFFLGRLLTAATCGVQIHHRRTGPTRPILFCQPLQGVGGLQVLIPRLAQPAAEITLTGALLGRCRVALVPPRTRALLDLIPGTQPPLPTPGP